MKKVYLIVALAMLGFVSVNANMVSSTKIIRREISESAIKYNADQISSGNILIAIQQTVFKCTVTVKFRSANVDVTMTFTGNSCGEAWNSAKKVVDVFVK